MSLIISIVIGYVLDMIIGTPKMFKKIRAVFAGIIKRFYAKLNSKTAILATFIILIVFGGFSYGIVYVLKYYNMIAGIIAESIICYFCVSCKEIKDSSDRVHKALKRGYIKRATKLFNTITENGEIDEPREIAENIIIMIMDATIDNVVAPIFYMLIFGGVGGVCYKLIVIISDSTGQVFVRVLKNIAEFIPARVAAFFILISAKLLSMNCKNAIKIFKRDRYKVKSLNRGLILSICAGALNIKLNLRKSGTEIGDSNKIITHNDIKKTFEMINIASLLTLVSLVAVRLVFVLFIV